MQVKLINPEFKSDFGANLLKFRGIDDVEWYLSPQSPKYLENPELLCNIEEGSELFQKKILDPSNKNILVIVDSDNDGYTSAAIIYLYLKKIAPDKEVDYWLHQGKQHGLEDHIARLIEEQEDYSLVIIPDAGSNDYEFMIQTPTLPYLVLDHHLAEPPYAPNACIINNQLSANYENKDLTGAGVVWQFCRYIDMDSGTYYADDLIDLAAWGIIGDMGSLLDYENRYIIYHGLNNVKNFFFKALCDKQAYSMNNKVNPISVAFYIVPLTNAMIRIGTMEEKTRLFEAYIKGEEKIPSGKRGAKGTLEFRAVESARECTNARTHQNKAKDQMVEKLEQKIFKYDLLENKVLFVRLDDDDNFPPELVGLVAMQLSAKYKKPTLVGRLNAEGYDRGSIRGLNDSALTSLKDYLESTGMFEYVQGHDNAAGFSIRDEYLSDFHKRANEELKDIDFGENCFNVNFIVPANNVGLIEDITLDLDKYSQLWGQDNDEPLIYIQNLHIKQKDIQVIGKNANTLKIEKDGITYIKFFATVLIEDLVHTDSDLILNIVGKPNLNEWMGRYTPQIIIEDCEFRKDSILEF